MRTLLLLRHAKSDPAPGLPDAERPLNRRGCKAAERLGQWMRDNHLRPEWLVSSPARRAAETVEQLRRGLEIPDTLVHIDERLYLADRTALLEVAAHCPQDMDHIMLVAHNPGLDELLIWLCGADLPHTEKNKLMTTATLARIGLPDDWRQLVPGCGKLLEIVRPGDLDTPA